MYGSLLLHNPALNYRNSDSYLAMRTMPTNHYCYSTEVLPCTLSYGFTLNIRSGIAHLSFPLKSNLPGHVTCPNEMTLARGMPYCKACYKTSSRPLELQTRRRIQALMYSLASWNLAVLSRYPNSSQTTEWELFHSNDGARSSTLHEGSRLQTALLDSQPRN